MASKLLFHASRDLARAARIVASRRAALPVGRSGRSGVAAVPDLPLCDAWCSCCHPPTTQQLEGSHGLRFLSNPNMAAAGRKGEAKVEFVVENKDLESDEAMWALYERWCKAFNQPRDRDEMVHRFPEFKETVLAVVSSNKADLPCKRRLNKFADGKLMDSMVPKLACDFPMQFHPIPPGTEVYEFFDGHYEIKVYDPQGHGSE